MNFGYLNVEFYLSSVLLVSLVSQVLPLTVEPNVLFVEENWPLQKPLEVEICGDSFKQVRIVLGNDQGVFGLVPLTAKCGTLKLGGKHLDADTIDPEGKKGQFFSLVFEEKNKLQRSTLDVQVVDVNDNPPEFLNLPAEIELSPQQSVVGSVVYTVEVKDPDTGIGGVSRFAISGTDKFAIVNEKCSNSRCSAQLELKKPFEANKVEVLEISARDGASITKSSNEKRALLKITGVPGLQHHGYQKPNAPIFMSVFEGPLHISQNLRLSSKIVKVEAKSVVERNKNIIFYELGKPSAYFDVEKNTGWIRLKKSLQTVGDEPLLINVTAKSLDNSTGTSSILLQVLVDHDREEQERSLPNCATSHYTAVFNKVSSKLLVDEPIKVQNTDPNRDVRVVLNGKHSDYFHISPSKVRGSAVLTLQVLNSQALTLLDNRELQFQIQLHTSDAADPTSSNCSLTIKLFNPTDYLFSTQPPNFSDEFVVVASSTVSSKVPAPQFYRVELEENSPAQVILQLNIPDNVRIEINGEGSEYFAINNRGQLICLEALDAEHARQIDLDVILMQEDGHAEQGQTMHVIIDVLDVNDNAPQFEQSHYRFTLPENNQGFFQVKAFDEDEEENAQLSYSIVNEQNLKVSITINKGTGELTVGKIDADLLKATDGTIEFTVKASDYGVPQLSNTTNVVITVQSQRLNNSGPKFLQPKYDVVVECLPPTVNYTLLTVKAVSSQAVSNSIVYIVSEPAAPYFSITTSEDGAGELRLLKSLPETANSEDGFKFEVIARDVNDNNESRVPVTVYLKACSVELKYQAQAAKTAVLQKLANVDKKMTEESYSKFDTQPQTLNTKFVPWHYNIDLKENTPVGTQILKLEVPELAQTAFGFELMEENSRLLRLDNNGSILVASKIDYELEQSKEIKADVFAISDRQRLHFATVRVLIQDENDNKPQFRIPDKHKILLSEWTGVGTVLKLPIPLAEDADGSDAYSTIQYSLVEDTPDHYFEINSSTSELRLVRKLFVPENELRLIIRATDNSDNVRVEEATKNESDAPKNVSEINLIVVVIRHLKDSLAKVLDALPNRLEVFEDQPVGSVLTSLKSILPQSFKLDIRNSEYFAVIEDGELRLAKSLHGFGNRTLCIELQASLQNSTEYFTSKNICFFVRPTVLITESTETKASVDYFLPAVIIYWPPEDSIHTFKENKQYEMLLSVNASSTAPPTKLYSHGNSEHLRYKLVQMPNGDWKSFEIDANGVLTSSKPFDFEQKTNYELVVEVCDDDSNQKLLDRCARVRFEVVIEDLNDNCPYFPNNFTEPELFVIRENTAVQDHNKGLSLGNFEAAVRGQMENNSICYRLMDDQKHTFVISNAHKPELFVKKSLDRETIAHYKLLIVAEDCIARSQSHCDSTVNTTISTQKVIVVEVEDVNDNIPKFTQRHYFGKVVDRMTPFGDTILQLKAVDLDEEDRGLRFLLASAIHTDKMVIPKKDSPFTVNYTTGAIVSHLLYASDIPRSYSFRVLVRDSADHEDECEVTVSLINFQHQVEFIFDKEVEVLEKELGRLERLLSEASKLRAVVDELLMYPNETTLTAHFLDKNRLALPAEEVKRSWKENKSLRGERAKKELASSFGQTRLFDAETKEEKEFNFASSTFQAITGSFKKYMPSFADFDLSLIISASALVVLFTILMCLFCWMTCCHSGTVDSVRLHDHRQWRPDTGPYYGTGTISGIIDPTLVGVSRRYRDQYSNMPNENEEFCRPSYSTPHSHQKVIPQQSTEF